MFYVLCFIKKIFLIIIVIFSLLFVAYSTRAYMASSTNYRIQFDSINIGGTRQTSTSYIMEDTIGEIATGISTSTSYKLKAGYQQMQEEYISLSLSTSSLTLLPSIGGLTGGTATGTVTATVITDGSAGYSLYINASTSPALQSGSLSFADYTPASAGTPDFNWLISSTDSEFGFTAEGADIVQKFKDNGDACNTGTNDTVDSCWYNFSTSNETISQIYSANHPSGVQTTIRLKAESDSENLQEEGTYQGTMIVTAVAN